MGKIKRMDQVKSILRSYLETGSVKATARHLQFSRNTVRDYLRRARAYDEDLSKVLELSEEQLLGVFYRPQTEFTTSRQAVFEAQQGYWISELRRVGVTRQLLWEEYRLVHPDGYGYSRFCDLLRQAIGRRDLTLSLDHQAGEVMQVDFAGKKMSWVDQQTGEVFWTEVLVAVLPHSQYTFAIALASQQVGDFIEGLNQALLFFGKRPQIILSDNLKSYVSRADRYEPKFNELCSQLGAHYGIDLQATRVAKPKDKASVENMVSTVYNRIYGPLRNEVFPSLEDLNEGINRQLKHHNAKGYQKKEGSRQSVFEEFEAPVMRDLPPDLFEIKKTTGAKVQRNYHVFLGEEKNYYSVPYQYVGKQTTVLYTSKMVEVYLDNQRIAVHQRLLGKNTFMHRTEASHMPKSHQEWKKAQGYDGAYFLSQAQQIGSASHWAISKILISKSYQSQTFNACKGVLHLAKRYSPQRLEAAALRCQQAGKVTYSMLKRILMLGLDKQASDDTTEDFVLPQHANIRGPKTYY